jgi:hypothetical protein
VVGVEAGGHSPEIAEIAAIAARRGMVWMAGAWSTEMMDCSEVEMSRRMEDSLGKVPTWFQKYDDRGGVNRGSGGKSRKAKRLKKKYSLPIPGGLGILNKPGIGAVGSAKH